MHKKTLTVLLLGALSFFYSCVDNNYDLVNKEITTDIKLEGNKITLPIGGLKAFVLDEIINVEDIEILEKGADGLFSISVNDSISLLEESIDPIRFSVAPINEVVSIDFKDVDIDEVHINATTLDPIKFNAPDISLSDLNDKLPVLESNAGKGVTNETLNVFFDQLEAGTLPPSLLPEKFTINETVTIENERVDCKFNYALPKEVEYISSIKFGSETSGDKGTLVNVTIKNPKALLTVDKTVDYEVVFPEMFLLSEGDNCHVSDDRHKVWINDLPLEGEETVISFYIDELTGLEKFTDGVIDIDEEILYTIIYKVSGDVPVSADIKREDLHFNVSMQVPLAFKDIKGKTKDIEVDFEPIDLDFHADFNNLEYIDSIYYIKFKKEESMLRFESDMDTQWFNEFKLKDGFALKIDFPDNIVIDDNISTYEGKGSAIRYDDAEHAYYIYDLHTLGSSHWNIALERLDLYVPVDSGKCDIDVKASIYFVDNNKDAVNQFVLGGAGLESMAATLEKLKGEKSAKFTMLASDLVIEDAVLHTDKVYSVLGDSANFSFQEEVPDELGRIESIDFTEDVAINFNLNILGADDIGTDINFKLYALFPSFLQLDGISKPHPNVKTTLVGDTMFIDAVVDPVKDVPVSFELQCKRLDFTKEASGSLLPEVGNDGKKYLSYDGYVEIAGEVYVDDVDLHANILEKLDEVKFDLDVTLDEIQVKSVHGIYDGEIENITETIDLDLGEELDFLKDEKNSITLAEPQIEFVVKNPIGVPVDVDLKITGKDENGEVIPTSVINERISILPAEYNEETGEITPVETKLFLTNNIENVSKIGYTNVQVENLDSLLVKIPSTIDIDVAPVIDKSKTHHIDISQPISFSGSYGVNIPLKFKNFSLCYSDTISGLKESLGESFEMFSNISVATRMSVINTIPVGLSLDLKPIDEDGKILEDLTIERVKINAGLGGGVKDSEQEAQSVEILIKSATGDFTALDGFVFAIEALSNHTTGSVGIKGQQGVKISNLVLEVKGDIEVDLSEGFGEELSE